MAIVGVVPAAGRALRLQPLSCSKEMIDVGGKPIIEYLMERMRTAGVDEVRVVTRPEKKDVIAHATRMGAKVVLDVPAHIGESLALGLNGLAPADIALLGFPDSIWEPVDGFVRLIAAIRDDREVALGLFHAPELVGADFVVFDAAGEITDIDIKPATPRSEWIWGAAAARVRTLSGIEREEWPSTHMVSLQRRGVALNGVRLSSAYLDIGTPSALERASAFLARHGPPESR